MAAPAGYLADEARAKAKQELREELVLAIRNTAKEITDAASAKHALMLLARRISRES